MTEFGGFSPQPQSLPQRAKERIDIQVEDLLTNAALSDEASAMAIDELFDEVVSASSPAPDPAPAVIAPADPPVPAWAVQQSPPRPVLDDDEDDDADEDDLGGETAAFDDDDTNRVYLPSGPTEQSDDEDKDTDPAPDYEERYALWRQPEPEPLQVPDDVADVAPRTDDTTRAFVPDRDTPGAPAAHQTRVDEVARWWIRRPRWVKIAAPTGTAILVVIAATMMALAPGSGRHPSIDAPPPTALAESPAQPPTTDTPLLPVSVTAHCPAGSSDPASAFGNDKAEAWVCTRLYNVDNSILTIAYRQPVVVSKITVIPGFDYVEPNGEDHWGEHRLVTRILWRIGGRQFIQNIAPTRGGATLTVPHVATQMISATILSTQRPARPGGSGPLPGVLSGPDDRKIDKSMAISRITITGHRAGDT